MNHIMIDLETMGTRPNAPIISIGAVKFDPSKKTLGKEFYRQIDLGSAFFHGVPDGSTVKWWLQQSEQARIDAANGNCPLAQALKDLTAFCDDWTNMQVWGNGPHFDITILEYAYFKVGLAHPWAFWNVRCCRTIAELAGERPPKVKGTAHNALVDAVHQAKWVSEYWCKIMSGPTTSPPPKSAAVDDPLDDI